MKKIIFMAILLPTMLFAQEKPSDSLRVKKYTISGNLNVSEPGTFGFSFENNSDEKNQSYILNLSAAVLTVDFGGKDVTGTGFAIESGLRKYFDDGYGGFYGENFISYGSVKFSESFIGVGSFEGKYSYFSLFNTNVGYKWNLGNFSIDPSIGYIWKWEIKNDGFENRDVDNLSLRWGIKAGYRF